MILTKRIYDFDKLEKISKILDMNLEYLGCGTYIDLEPNKYDIDCDAYLDWQIIKMLDKLPYEIVKDVLWKEGN